MDEHDAGRPQEDQEEHRARVQSAETLEAALRAVLMPFVDSPNDERTRLRMAAAAAGAVAGWQAGGGAGDPKSGAAGQPQDEHSAPREDQSGEAP